MTRLHPSSAATLETLRGGLIVSCQARPGEPLFGAAHMAAMAASAVAGGAAGVRVNGPADIAAVRASVDVPLIGLWKDGDKGVYITPSLEHAAAAAAAGADIIALDATSRPRRDGLSLSQTIAILHDHHGVLVMADVASYDEGVAAAAAGADMVGTTLSGYLDPDGPPSGPDLALVGKLAANLAVPVIAEGRIHTPSQAAEAIELGAFAVVVGGAITRPASITARFVASLGGHDA
ncbi:N-acetylmannosamine-6-phosphate 2-epimerase [soil metagenome]